MFQTDEGDTAHVRLAASVLRISWFILRDYSSPNLIVTISISPLKACGPW